MFSSPTLFKTVFMPEAISSELWLDVKNSYPTFPIRIRKMYQQFQFPQKNGAIAVITNELKL